MLLWTLMRMISMSKQTVQPNDFVVVKRIFDDGYRLIKADPEGTYYFNKVPVSLSCLIGLPFPCVLELSRQNSTLKLTTLSEQEMFEVCDLNSDLILSGGESDGVGGGDNDNRNIQDEHGSAQKLSMEEIEVLKQSASSNREIIDVLVRNSSTFEIKSIYSQAKYIKKKRQKYTNHYRLLKPSVKLLTDMYFVQGPSKQVNLRLDTLAQMLTACNVRSGGKYLVIDNYLGLLTAAVIERLVGVNPESIVSSKDNLGTCIQMYLEPGPVATWRSCVEALNIPNDILSQVLLSCQIHQAYRSSSPRLKGTGDDVVTSESGVVVVEEEMDLEPSQELSEGVADQPEGPVVTTASRSRTTATDFTPEERESFAVNKKRRLDDRAKRKSIRRIEEAKALDILSPPSSSSSSTTTGSMDGLLVICRNTDPSSFMPVLMDFLFPSSPFAVYCHVSEPLAECMIRLRDKAVDIRLSETWLRRYQVLPGRTRPDMNMSTTGGFLLTGTRVVSNQ